MEKGDPMTHPAQHQGKLIYSSAPWKIYEQDAGMGERDYAVIINDIFYCRTEDSQTAMKIVESIRSRPAPSPDKGCHWYKENHCTREEWLNEWERRAGPTQITLTSELPAIIPPLPEGDTKDLKTWKEYWIKHDAAIATKARNATLDELETFVRTDHSLNRQIGKRIMIAKIQSLRSTTEAQK
jgi:hypothetical protein